MPLFKVGSEKFEPIAQTSFSSARLMERRDLQRLLKADISVIGDDLMVLAEEFSNWEDSSRRIDLLCLDRQARLVVVEIKRTEDGAHMELQAVRYAAMVSSMTLDQAVDALARDMGGDDHLDEARGAVLDFIETSDDGPPKLSGQVRIVLISADFSQELTTSVLWLNRQGLNIVCTRLRPYKLDDQVLVEATQIIPLPEAASYEVKLREQARDSIRAENARGELYRNFWSELIDRSRSRTQLFASRGAPPGNWINAAIGRTGFKLGLSLTDDRAMAELYIRIRDAEDTVNLRLFEELKRQQAQIEQSFGEPLEWDELPDRLGCRISKSFRGGLRLQGKDRTDLQDTLIDALIRLDRAFRDPIQRLQV